jgi:hypothetical protein
MCGKCHHTKQRGTSAAIWSPEEGACQLRPFTVTEWTDGLIRNLMHAALSSSKHEPISMIKGAWNTFEMRVRRQNPRKSDLNQIQQRLKIFVWPEMKCVHKSDNRIFMVWRRTFTFLFVVTEKVTVAVTWTCTQKIPRSNLGRVTSHHAWEFPRISTVSPIYPTSLNDVLTVETKWCLMVGCYMNDDEPEWIRKETAVV